MSFKTVEQCEAAIRDLMSERGRWQSIKVGREGRVAEASRFIAETENQIAAVRARMDELVKRYDYFQRTDWPGVYRYDRKLDAFLLVRSEGDTTEYPVQGDPMCDAGRIARMLKDDPYAATFLDARLQDFAAWVIAVQRTKW